ncbi:MAG TPA: SCO family protein, partial [Aggregatilineales bacterium]|nr:SCO family protein [Aggregatilineales bacterium]
PSTYINDLLGAVISPPRFINNFTMPATTGTDYTYSEHHGKIRLVYFGYMTCPDVCPTTMADLLRAYREIEEPSDSVEVLFITIDPERDSLERLQLFTGAFHSDFIGLRPQSDEQLQALLDDFGVKVEKREVDSALEYLLDHSAAVLMIAPDGRMISQYPFGVSYTEIAHDVDVMMDYMLVS